MSSEALVDSIERQTKSLPKVQQEIAASLCETVVAPLVQSSCSSLNAASAAGKRKMKLSTADGAVNLDIKADDSESVVAKSATDCTEPSNGHCCKKNKAADVTDETCLIAKDKLVCNVSDCPAVGAPLSTDQSTQDTVGTRGNPTLSETTGSSCNEGEGMATATSPPCELPASVAADLPAEPLKGSSDPVVAANLPSCLIPADVAYASDPQPEVPVQEKQPPMPSQGAPVSVDPLV